MTEREDAANTIAEGYRAKGAALELGAVRIEDQVVAEAQVRVPLAMLNRHGLVAGATGSGKTKTLQLLAEQLSSAGVPVVMADMKGDLSGLAKPGETSEQLTERAGELGDDWSPSAFPTQFLSLGTGGKGIPVRATITSFGPILLAKVLGLNATQESTLGLIFHWADSKGLELLDTKDLRAVIQHLLSDEGKADLKGIGGVSSATAGVILRALVNLEAQGGDTFFGEPELEIADLIRQEGEQGVLSLLELDELAGKPALFSTFLMWLLAELFHELPEVGDVEQPKLVFFLDEAHLLFDDASKAFLEQVEQTVKLIRSKGVGVFFCTQLPTDIPNAVLSQLGARVQHVIRAFTPDDQKALRQTAKTYPVSEVYDIEQALTSLGTGEAVVTVLSETGAPTPVAWTKLRAPRSLMGSIGAEAVTEHARSGQLYEKYAETVDSESAYEKLSEEQAETGSEQAEAPKPRREESGDGKSEKEEQGFIGQAMANPAVRSFLRSTARTVGKEITRSVFGTSRRRR